MKKLLLLLMATAILFSMSSVFVYADFAADAPVQSYDFEDYSSNDRVFNTLFKDSFVSGDSYVKTNTHKTQENNTANVYRLGQGKTSSYMRFVLDNTYEATSSIDRRLFEYNMQFYLENISDTGSFEISLIGSRETFSRYFSGKLVITNSQIKWYPGGGQTYGEPFTASLSDAGISTGKWVNLTLLGDIVNYNNTNRITIVINDKIIPLYADANVSIADNSNGITYTSGNYYSVLPMKPAKEGRYVRSFEIAVKDEAAETVAFVDTINTAVGDGFKKFKDIEAQALDMGAEKSINLNDYFFNYDSKNTTFACSIDEKFGTIENGVLTFNTTAAISDVATLTAGDKEFTFNYTVKGALANLTTAEKAFSSNDGESITVDSVTYSRYAMLVAKAPEVAGYTLKEYGVLLMANESPYITTENVIKGVADKAKTTADGSYGILFEGSGIQSGVKYYLRPYAIYVDSEGKATNKYGNARTVTLND